MEISSSGKIKTPASADRRMEELDLISEKYFVCIGNRYVYFPTFVGAHRMNDSRRAFIKTASAGIAGAFFGGVLHCGRETSVQQETGGSTVSFAHGGDRRKLIREVLAPMEEKIRNDIRGKQVIIKPNCVFDNVPLCASDVDAIRGVLDFLKPLYAETVVVAESTASAAGTMKCFQDYQYTILPKEYDVELVDLNQSPFTKFWILDGNRHPQHVKIIDTFLDADNYIISLARMKSHNVVVATLSTKNIIMASPINLPKSHPEFFENRYEKTKMHAGDAKGTNYNIFRIAQRIQPGLAIIDGFVGMEGNGPVGGTPIEHGVALAGFDMIAVDRVGVELMGVDYKNVAYLQWLSAAGVGQGDIDKITVTGPDYRQHIKQYKMNENIKWQLEWKA